MLEKVKEILFKVLKIASKANLQYAVCIWKDPFSEINYRVGYFEDSNETLLFAKKMQETYRNKLEFPYIIYSSVLSMDNSGNLFD